MFLPQCRWDPTNRCQGMVWWEGHICKCEVEQSTRDISLVTTPLLDLWRASLRFLCLPSLDAMRWSFSSVLFACAEVVIKRPQLSMQWKIHCFADSLPSPSQSVDGGVGEGSADLDDSIVVVKTPADVGHGRPLLFDGRYLSVCSRLEGVNITYPAHPGLETRGSDDVWHDQPAHLYTPGSGEDTQGSTYLIEADWHEVNVRGPHRLVSFIPILAEELTRWNFTMGGIIQSTYWLLMENNICWSKKVISSAISSALKLERLSVEGNWNDHDHRIETVSFVPQEASESHWDWFCFFHFSSPPRGAARRSYVPPVTVWTSRQFPPGNLQSNFLIWSHQSPDRAWWSSVAKHSKPSCWRRSLTGIFSALLSE